MRLTKTLSNREIYPKIAGEETFIIYSAYVEVKKGHALDIDIEHFQVFMGIDSGWAELKLDSLTKKIKTLCEAAIREDIDKSSDYWEWNEHDGDAA